MEELIISLIIGITNSKNKTKFKKYYKSTHYNIV